MWTRIVDVLRRSWKVAVALMAVATFAIVVYQFVLRDEVPERDKLASDLAAVQERLVSVRALVSRLDPARPDLDRRLDLVDTMIFDAGSAAIDEDTDALRRLVRSAGTEIRAIREVVTLTLRAGGPLIFIVIGAVVLIGGGAAAFFVLRRR